jgi:predicted outer membrane protein
MKIQHLLTAVAATALIGGAAYAQQSTTTTTTTSTDATAPAAATGTATSTSATTTDASGASVTTTMTTNGPVPDTRANRAKYGQPMSRAGRRTAPRGN